MWFYFPSWGEPFVKKTSIQFIIWTTDLFWFFVKGFQIVKHTSEIIMFLHCYKYWRPKMWGKLVCVSTSCPFFDDLEPFASSMFSFFISFSKIKDACNYFHGLPIGWLHGLRVISISKKMMTSNTIVHYCFFFWKNTRTTTNNNIVHCHYLMLA